MNLARAIIPMLAVSTSTPVHSAVLVDECPAERYQPCPSFHTSRSIKGHTPLMENAVAGYVRSEGNWSIHVNYGPPEMCAKVSLTVDMGPLDADRTYERVFRNGRGVIADSGYFLHPSEDIEKGLRILTHSCRIPDTRDSERAGSEAQERLEWEAERERLEWAAERERLASEAEARERLDWEAEQERLALAKEHERLARAAERRRQEAERRRAQAQQALERQREARARQRRAALAREHELERQRRERERLEAAQGDGLADFLTGVTQGLVIANGLAQLLGDGGGEPGLAVPGLMLPGAGIGTAAPSLVLHVGGAGAPGGSCQKAQRRIAARLEAQQDGLLAGAEGICLSARRGAEFVGSAVRELRSAGCPHSELRIYEQYVVDARKAAQSVCN